MLKALGRSTAALTCAVLLASCSSGDADEKAAGLCGTTSSSEEAVLLREVLETEGFTTKARKSMGELVKKLERDLRSMPPEKQTYYHLICSFQADTETRLARANFSFAWAPRTAPQQPWFTGDVSYDVNGARGVADNATARLLVQCDMPGDLATQSQKAYLSADAYYSFMDFEPDKSQAATDRKMALTALMTRRVTEALGCGNKPLEKSPVVKPLPTP
ncbi:hypothetical protein [Streptomyces sp. NPDC047718]|uniref:hypothetical protein n=1 Tax=Streptomyces sp. NPDC047718 TaxID=3155479 RepID=UPI0033F2BFFD